MPIALREIRYAADPAIRPVDGLYFRSHDRVDQLFVGVVVAYLEVVRPGLLARAAKRLRHVLWPTGLALVALAWTCGGFFEGGAFPVVWQFTAMAVGVALVMINALHLPNAVTRLHSHPAGYPVARVSHGMYLLHPFVIFAVRPLVLRTAGPAGFLLLVASAFAVTWTLAAAMFLAFERPMLEAGSAIARRIDDRRA